MIIKFNNDGVDEMKGQHVNGVASDFTLCGITLDNDSETAGTYEEKQGKITCKDCLEIINYCKTL